MKIDSTRRHMLRSLGAMAITASTGVLGAGPTGSARSTGQDTGGVQSDSDQWPSYQFDVHNTGYNPNVVIDDTDVIETRWTAETGYRVTAAPAIAYNTVYVGSEDSTLYAFDLDDGSEVWTYDTEAQFRATPAVVDGTVYVTNRDGKVFALDAETGELEWDNSISGARYTPVATPDVVYVGTWNGVTALDRESGEIEWESDEIDGEVRSSPVLGSGGVYAGEQFGRRIYGFDRDDGTLRWEYETGASTTGSPAYADGTVYCGSRDERLYALDADTGDVTWECNTGDAIETSPVVADEVVYVGNGNGVFALDADDGQEIWHVSQPSLIASPILTPSYLLVPGSRTVHVLDRADGAEHTSIELDERPTSLAVVDGSLVFGSRDHNVYAYDLADPIEVSFTYEPTVPAPGEPITFEADAVDNDPHYAWDFGDGTAAEGRTVDHAYGPGEYLVELTVTSAEGVGRQTESIAVLLPPVVGDAHPTDPDGDGLYEDVTGTGTVSIVDVQALYQHLDSDAVQEYPDAYDFSGTGDVGVADVQALYTQLVDDQ